MEAESAGFRHREARIDMYIICYRYVHYFLFRANDPHRRIDLCYTRYGGGGRKAMMCIVISGSELYLVLQAQASVQAELTRSGYAVLHGPPSASAAAP